MNKAFLVVGNLAFVVATFVAHSNPATGYEVSILAATPILFWLGIAVALLSAIWVLTFAEERLIWIVAAGLASLAVLSVAALPLVRGYFFYGQADPLNHLGWARELLYGKTTFFGDIYPASHTLSVLIATLGGVTLERGMIVVVFLLMGSFVALTTLTVWTVIPDRTAVSIGLVSALLFLPLNHIGFSPLFKTYSLASFVFPFVTFLIVKHVTSTEHDPTLSGRLSATDLGFLFGGIALVFYHPQVAANVIVFVGAIAMAQLVASRTFPTSLVARSKPVFGQFLALTLVFFVWNSQHPALFDLSENLFNSLLGLFFGTEQAGEIVGQRAQSAGEAGKSVFTLFVRIFLLQAVYVVVAAGVVGARVAGLLQPREDVGIVLDVFTIGGLTTALFFLMHFVGDISGYFFRHLGFGMILTTVVAVVGLHRLVGSVRNVDASIRPKLKLVSVALMLAALALSLTVLFPTPYIALPTSHVSEQQYTGHASAFEHTVEGAALAGPRISPKRYYEARGVNLDNRLQWGVSPEEMRSGLREVRRNDYPTRDFYYLFVTETDRQREIVAYDGFRYGPEAFDSVPTQEGVSRVHSNGEVNVYQVLYSTHEDTGPNE